MYLKYKNMFPVVNKTYKICDLLDAVEDPCPISPGQHSYTFSQTVPSYALAVRKTWSLGHHCMWCSLIRSFP